MHVQSSCTSRVEVLHTILSRLVIKPVVLKSQYAENMKRNSKRKRLRLRPRLWLCLERASYKLGRRLDTLIKS